MSTLPSFPVSFGQKKKAYPHLGVLNVHILTVKFCFFTINIFRNNRCWTHIFKIHSIEIAHEMEAEVSWLSKKF